MSTPAPVRSGFRMTGPEVPAAAYAHPPLVESWLGVDFAASGQLVQSDFDALHAALGPEWPSPWREVASDSGPPGLQVSNVMGDRALRATPQGFAFGWLGYSGERYPRYEAVRDGFVAVFDSLRALAGRDRKALIPQHWSVQYRNRIPRGTVWSKPGEWTFFKLWQPAVLNGLGTDPAGVQATWDLPLEGERGNLTIEFRHAIPQTDDETECAWLNLTTSGPVDNADASLFDGLDYGREVIIRSFNELVSADAKTYWGVRPR